jgi:hypothetical protein
MFSMEATPMPEIIETTVYRLDELSDHARERARDWYRQTGFDHDWFDFVFEDFERICAILGIRLRESPVRLMGGSSRQQPHIFFRGFSSQGDGACFEAFYAYAKNAPRRIRQYAPKDAELHQLAQALQDIQRRNFFQLRAEARHRGPGDHEYCMAISVERRSACYQDMTVDAEDAVIEALRGLARWLYRQLEREYDFLTSDAVVDEAITANEYTFTESGRRFG